MWITYMYKPIGLGLAIQFVGPDDVVAEEFTHLCIEYQPPQRTTQSTTGVVV